VHNETVKHLDETFAMLNLAELSAFNTLSASQVVLNHTQGQVFAKVLVALMPDAAVFTVDAQRKISFWSEGASHLLGFSSDELLGESCLSSNRCAQCMTACGLMQEGAVNDLHLILHNKAGEPQAVSKYALAFKSAQGAFDGGIELLIKQTSFPDILSESDLAFGQHYGLFSHDPQMQKVFEMVKRVAVTEFPVLIRGESGTGKELIAHAIHAESPRRHQPFIAVNCASFNANILESELFGHVKGAFTGAVRGHAGVFERAKGGTLFLDEIAEIPFELQAKLLRVLETGQYIPLGGEKALTADVRILTATHRALRDEVKHGRFRQDLLYRLRVVPIFLPALRERRSDIPLLTKHLLQSSLGAKPLPSMTSAAMRLFMAYDWPGNIRELKNAINYALVMSDGLEIDVNHLPPEIADHQIMNSTLSVLTQGAQPSVEVNGQLKLTLSKDAIEKLMETHAGDLSAVAKALGVSRTTLWRYRKK
jgi:transcriptional regulator with PAS, ATPase and Fis domain